MVTPYALFFVRKCQDEYDGIEQARVALFLRKIIEKEKELGFAEGDRVMVRLSYDWEESMIVHSKTNLIIDGESAIEVRVDRIPERTYALHPRNIRSIDEWYPRMYLASTKL